MTFTDRHALAAQLEQLAQVLRQPAPTIACGQTDPDPNVERRVVAMRQQIGAPTDDSACGRMMVWSIAYRCAECGRWFHRECLVRHFEAHQSPRVR